MRMLNTLGDVAGNRVELFVVEWQEERRRLLDMLVLLLAGAVCASMALFTITLAIVAAFWDTQRALVLALLIAAYLGAAAAAFWVLRCRLRRWQAFSATIEQLKKDRACFKNQN
ncbi:MAG TPA: phage holin family protein [Candidatus Aquilonibacter sp.]|nr:phage holin family protein [Candidatus Aquilonibacter sp.]